jgi:hypothetical protein
MKRKEVNTLKMRYEVGLQQLASAAGQVSTMQVELNDLKPQLKKSQEETDAVMIIIQRDSVEVEKKRALVRVDEEVANKKAGEAKIIKDDCEADLSKALPALESALSALDTLSTRLYFYFCKRRSIFFLFPLISLIDLFFSVPRRANGYYRGEIDEESPWCRQTCHGSCMHHERCQAFAYQRSFGKRKDGGRLLGPGAKSAR